MNNFNELIKKQNFKKIFLIYLIAAIVCSLICVGGTAYIYRDKISFALRYEKASEALEKEYKSPEKLKTSLQKLASSSDDITDVLLLDNNNNITFSANNSNLAWDSVFKLKKGESNKFLTSKKNNDLVFRFVKKDEFILSTVLADHFTDIYEDYTEENFYLNNFQSKNLYLISLLGTSENGLKAYAVSHPSKVPYGMAVLKASACILMLLFMIYWVIIAFWVYQNALKSKLYAPIWGIVALVSNLAGVFVYEVYKHMNKACIHCGAVQSKANTFCIHCGKKTGTTCSKCGQSIKPEYNYCPKCGQKNDE